MSHHMHGLFSQHWPPLKRQPLGGRDCVLFIFISPTPNTELASLDGCTYTFSFACVHTSACERHVQGACPWVSTHTSSVHVESTMGSVCSCISDRVQAGIPVSVGARTHVCFLPSRISFSILYVSDHRDFPPPRWEVLLMGTKSRHGKSYSFSQESVLLSPSSSLFFALFSPPLPISHLSPPPSGRKLI